MLLMFSVKVGKTQFQDPDPAFFLIADPDPVLNPGL